jgi:hypothetical protein
MVNYYFGRHLTLLVLFLEVVTNHSFYYCFDLSHELVTYESIIILFSLKIRMYLDNSKPNLSFILGESYGYRKTIIFYCKR